MGASFRCQADAVCEPSRGAAGACRCEAARNCSHRHLAILWTVPRARPAQLLFVLFVRILRVQKDKKRKKPKIKKARGPLSVCAEDLPIETAILQPRGEKEKRKKIKRNKKGKHGAPSPFPGIWPWLELGSHAATHTAPAARATGCGSLLRMRQARASRAKPAGDFPNVVVALKLAEK